MIAIRARKTELPSLEYRLEANVRADSSHQRNPRPRSTISSLRLAPIPKVSTRGWALPPSNTKLRLSRQLYLPIANSFAAASHDDQHQYSFPALRHSQSRPSSPVNPFINDFYDLDDVTAPSLNPSTANLGGGFHDLAPSFPDSLTIDVDDLASTYALGSDRDSKLRAIYQDQLSLLDPIALRLDQFIILLNDRASVHMEFTSVSDVMLMCLLEEEWLEADIIILYLQLFTKQHPRFQILKPWTVFWILDALDGSGYIVETSSTFDIDAQTFCLLIFMHVQKSHLMFCVCELPEKIYQYGKLFYYNSLDFQYWRQSCYDAVNDFFRVLHVFASRPGSRLSNITWDVEQCESGIQTNAADCGVFTCSTAAALVLNLPVPKHVVGQRSHILSQIITAARHEQLQWPHQSSFFHSTS